MINDIIIHLGEYLWTYSVLSFILLILLAAAIVFPFANEWAHIQNWYHTKKRR